MNNTVEKFLQDKGFSILRDSIQCKLDGAEWCAYKRTEIDTKYCECNDNLPQIAVVYHNTLLGGEYRESYKIELVQESNLGWVDLSFYGLNENDILTKLNKLEVSLVKAWEVCWDED